MKRRIQVTAFLSALLLCGLVLLTIGAGTSEITFSNGIRMSADGGIAVQMISDVTTAQYGSVVMNDASADFRFDVSTSSGDAPIGVVTTKVNATVQGTTYDVCIGGYGYVAPDEDETVTRGYIVYGSTGTAGYAKFSATVAEANHNAEIGHTVESCAAFTIDPATGVNTGTETITVSGSHGWAANTAVIYWNSGGASIGGLTDGKVYWVTSPSGATLKLSSSPGGAAIDLTSAGDDATQYLMKLPLCVIHWN